MASTDKKGISARVRFDMSSMEHGIHFHPEIDKRLEWISDFVSERFYGPMNPNNPEHYHGVTSTTIYAALVHALEDSMAGYPINRRKWCTEKIGGRRWMDPKL